MRLNSNLTYEPEVVISLASPSRAGSTIIKHALCLHPDICSLAGEEEPYYKLACNGYPWHASDKFSSPNGAEAIRMMIANELHGYEVPFNRSWLQALHIEEPPFVELDELSVEPRPTLVLKTPQNCYRRGVLEHLYPKAKVLYVRITRDKPAIVNGLIDGWESPWFSARYVPAWNQWWKFDMPPGWERMEQSSFEERSIFQMQSAEMYLNQHYPEAISVSYEYFCQSWRGVIRSLWRQLGLDDHKLHDYDLPVLMATDQPDPERWKKKRPHLEGVC